MTPVRSVAIVVVALAAAIGAGPRWGTMTSAPTAAIRGTPAWGTYGWPLRGEVLRGFDLPSGQYGSGHRGIDIAAPFASEVRAAQDGVVAFAGWVAGSLFVSIDHDDGVRTTYSWLSSVLVSESDAVERGQVIALSGHGHPELPMTHLHFGARIGDTYIDPMLLLEGGDVSDLIRLAPLAEQAGPRSGMGIGGALAFRRWAGTRGPPPRMGGLERPVPTRPASFAIP